MRRNSISTTAPPTPYLAAIYSSRTATNAGTACARAKITHLSPEPRMALVVFRSKAAAEIYMFAETARRLLSIIGKAEADRGVIRAEEVGDALDRLTAAVEQEKADLSDEQARRELDERTGDAHNERMQPITLGQRAFPLIGMLRAAQKKHVDVTWGV
jgi:uncharacterized protein DUF1840